METRPERRFKITLKMISGTIVGALAILGLVMVLAAPHPEQRKYPDRIQVRFWHMWTADWAKVVGSICDEFNESQTKYEIIPLSVPSRGADQKFMLAVAGGDPPDVMAQWNPVIPSWVDSKLLMPLDDMMTPEEWKEFQETAYPIAKKIGIYKGKLYGVTTGTNVWGLYYHPSHLQAAGLDPNKFPESLEELMEWAQKLHRFDAKGNLTRMGFMPVWFAEFAPVFGGGFYDWEKGELSLNSPENLRALTFLVNERKKIGFNNVVRFESGLKNAASGGGDWPFIGGFYSITLDGMWRVEEIRKYNEAIRKSNELILKEGGNQALLKKELVYMTAPVPPPAGGRKNAGFADGNFLVIPKGAKQAEGAWEFIKFWSGIENPERAGRFYTMGGWMPINPQVANSKHYQDYVRANPQFKTFLDLMPSENLQPLPPVPYQMFLSDKIGRADDFATRGTKTPEEALNMLEKEVKDEQARRKEFGNDE